MRNIASAFCSTAIVLSLLPTGAAQAQIARTWVSGAGSDSNPCTRTLPCATFAHAYANTGSSGEIDVLDGGDFGPLVIQHAITISNDSAGTAAVSIVTGGDGFQIDAGLTDAVVLRGLNLNGVGPNSGFGVLFQSGASLLIDHCAFQQFKNGAGIDIEASNPAMIWVKDTVLTGDGVSNSSSFRVITANSGGVTVHLERVQILGAVGNGIRVDGTVGPAPIDVELRDVTVDGANGGSAIVAVSATSGGPAVKLVADNVTTSHNAGYGFRAVGGTATVYLRHSIIEDNGVGIGVSSGGEVFSFGDNGFANNAGGDGAAPTPVALK